MENKIETKLDTTYMNDTRTSLSCVVQNVRCDVHRLAPYGFSRMLESNSYTESVRVSVGPIRIAE